MKKLLKSFVSVFLTGVIAAVGVCHCFAADEYTNYREGYIDLEDGGKIYLEVFDDITTSIFKTAANITGSTKDIVSVPKELFIKIYSTQIYYYKVNSYAFSNCSSLRSIDLRGFDTICGNAFENCVNLKGVFVYPTCDIEENAFNGCNKDKLVIYSYSDDNKVSAYAANNNFKYVNINNSAGCGDVNCDGSVNALDVSEIMQYILDPDNCLYLTYIEYNNEYFDVNKDGEINSADAAEILQKTLDSSYLMPCEK